MPPTKSQASSTERPKPLRNRILQIAGKPPPTAAFQTSSRLTSCRSPGVASAASTGAPAHASTPRPETPPAAPCSIAPAPAHSAAPKSRPSSWPPFCDANSKQSKTTERPVVGEQLLQQAGTWNHDVRRHGCLGLQGYREVYGGEGGIFRQFQHFRAFPPDRCSNDNALVHWLVHLQYGKARLENQARIR
jgi:hypothetical protein